MFLKIVVVVLARVLTRFVMRGKGWGVGDKIIISFFFFARDLKFGM